MTSISHAYVISNWRIYNETDGYYYVSYFPSSRSTVISGIKAWNSLSEIEFTTEVQFAGGTEIAIEYVDFNYNDTYASAYGSGNIAVYSLWYNLNETQKKETIVHEVGHELGLDHCQSSKETISVMRALGFNNKPYPLADDKEGISVIY